MLIGWRSFLSHEFLSCNSVLSIIYAMLSKLWKPKGRFLDVSYRSGNEFLCLPCLQLPSFVSDETNAQRTDRLCKLRFSPD